jgi:hypothetical protein
MSPLHHSQSEERVIGFLPCISCAPNVSILRDLPMFPYCYTFLGRPCLALGYLAVAQCACPRTLAKPSVWPSAPVPRAANPVPSPREGALRRCFSRRNTLSRQCIATASVGLSCLAPYILRLPIPVPAMPAYRHLSMPAPIHAGTYPCLPVPALTSVSTANKTANACAYCTYFHSAHSRRKCLLL